MLDWIETLPRRKWLWMIAGFNVRGEKLLVTKHASDASKEIEIQA